jgi:hypothetical protein
MVAVSTSITGNVSYHVIDQGARETVEGEEATWTTNRLTRDKDEQERATKARSLARSALQTVCTKSKFCLLCPEANKDRLDAAIVKAQQIARDFNATSNLTTVEVNVLVGKISPDDVEAVKAINSEVRDLMDTMARGLANLDVGVVREAARKAKSIGAMLEPNAQERVQKAIEVARAAAKEIVKAGETGAVEIDQVSIQRITEARTSFLDLDDATEVRSPEAAVPVVDFEPEVLVEALNPIDSDYDEDEQVPFRVEF